MKKLCAVLLCTLLFLTSCASKVGSMTSQDYLLELNERIVDDFGILSETTPQDAYTIVAPISERLYLTLAEQRDTGFLAQAELALYVQDELEKLDYSTFEYFFLMMLKVHDPDITIASINEIHDALGIGTYEVGCDQQIGYGSCTYYYQVRDDAIVFGAQFSAET